MKPGTIFYKMTGSGNDFVMFDGRHVGIEELTPAVIRELSDRRLGVGADGVALLEPRAPVDDVHFSFHFWNSDGSSGPMCGNGALCATRLATLIELAPAGSEVRFSTPAGIHRGRVVGDAAELYLPDCGPPRPLPALQAGGGEGDPMLVSPSVPHLVLEVRDVDQVAPEDRGPPLRHDPALGPDGANVNWVSPRADGTWKMRTYERGVEGETLACGTGAVACALALAARGRTASPARFWTRTGLPLDVEWLPTPTGATAIRLRGEGRLVYRGILSSILTDNPTARYQQGS